SRSRNSTAATGKVGANATVTSRRLEGMWVKTIVFTRPIRFASHAAPRCDAAFARRAPKKSAPTTPSVTPNRSKKKYERSEVVRKPPARLSRPNKAEILQSFWRLSPERTIVLVCTGASTAEDRRV